MWALAPNYLTERTQQVKIDYQLSASKSIGFGVPQSSIIGPLLLLIYVNDVSNTSSVSKFLMFANDTSIFLSEYCYITLYNNANDELKKIDNWLIACRQRWSRGHKVWRTRSRGHKSRPRPRTQKKSEAKAKDSPSEDRPSRGQGQECSRPRTQVQSTKKKGLQNFFSGDLQNFNNSKKSTVLEPRTGQLWRSRPRPRTSKCVLEDSTSASRSFLNIKKN